MMMRVLFYLDGSIRKVYDEALHNHYDLPSAPISDAQIADIANCRVNLATSTVYTIPAVPRKYIKIVDNVWVEMTQPEKDAVDAAIAAEQARIAAEVAAMAAKAQAIIDNLPTWQAISDAIDAATTIAAIKIIIKKLARVVYWLAKNQAD